MRLRSKRQLPEITRSNLNVKNSQKTSQEMPTNGANASETIGATTHIHSSSSIPVVASTAVVAK